MARYVIKFGGSSLADTPLMRRAAERLAALHESGHEVIGVLSAQGNTTDRLLSRAQELASQPDARELSALLCVGEQISVSLCALVLREMGLPAVSLCGWQAGLLAEEEQPLALIHDRVERELNAGKIVLIAGFQALDRHGDVVTLGRGGSDTTAVALAAFARADRCLIYTDVDGVYDRDPRRFPDAKKLDRLSCAQMYRMACSGARVLHAPCVALAQRFGIPLEVRSSFTDAPGTVIYPEPPEASC